MSGRPIFGFSWSWCPGPWSSRRNASRCPPRKRRCGRGPQGRGRGQRTTVSVPHEPVREATRSPDRALAFEQQEAVGSHLCCDRVARRDPGVPVPWQCGAAGTSHPSDRTRGFLRCWGWAWVLSRCPGGQGHLTRNRLSVTARRLADGPLPLRNPSKRTRFRPQRDPHGGNANATPEDDHDDDAREDDGQGVGPAG